MGDQSRSARYRERAAQMRAAAEHILDEGLRRILLQSAEEYEVMADAADGLRPHRPEQRAKRQDDE